jgi:hypothetical protein
MISVLSWVRPRKGRQRRSSPSASSVDNSPWTGAEKKPSKGLDGSTKLTWAWRPKSRSALESGSAGISNRTVAPGGKACEDSASDDTPEGFSAEPEVGALEIAFGGELWPLSTDGIMPEKAKPKASIPKK